jgi:hypothetical protein
VTILTCFWWQLAVYRSLRHTQEPLDQDLYRYLALRNRLSLWLTWALVITGALLLAVVDSLGQTIYVLLHAGELGT